MIGEIGAIAEAKAVGDVFAVVDFDGLDFYAGDLDGSGIKYVSGEAGAAGFGGRLVEDVLKSAADGDEGFGGGVDGDIVFLHEVEGANIVEAEDVVGVGVGVEDGVEAVDLVAEGLIAEIGRGVNEDALVAEAQEDRGAEAFVARV